MTMRVRFDPEPFHAIAAPDPWLAASFTVSPADSRTRRTTPAPPPVESDTLNTTSPHAIVPPLTWMPHPYPVELAAAARFTCPAMRYRPATGTVYRNEPVLNPP